MSLRQAKILWNPRQDEPKSVKVDESSWLFVKTLMTLSATVITLKAGTKEYALEAGGDSVGAAQGAADSLGGGGRKKLSELMLKRRYR